MNWRNYLKGIWLLACVAVLAWQFVACGQQSNPTLRGECSLLAGGIMVVLSLPLGLLWLWLVSGAGYLLAQFGIEIGAPSSIADVVVWLGFVVVGYLQWFVLLPWIVHKVRARRRTITEHG
jgi:hypothetical protein